jgi:hypothetical protein
MEMPSGAARPRSPLRAVYLKSRLFYQQSRARMRHEPPLLLRRLAKSLD